jgi:hypothetical protein
MKSTDQEQQVNSITDRSLQAAEHGDVWTLEDHESLLEHIRKIERLAQAVYDMATGRKA